MGLLRSMTGPGQHAAESQHAKALGRLSQKFTTTAKHHPTWLPGLPDVDEFLRIKNSMRDIGPYVIAC